MKRKNRAASASATSPEGKKKKVVSGKKTDASTVAGETIDFTSPERVVESLLAVTDLKSFFDDTWEKKPHFVKRENGDFYGSLFTKKDLESLLKKEEIQFIEDVSVSRYVEGKTELVNEEGSRVNLKHIKANGLAVQFHQPDRFKDEVWKLLESVETYFGNLVAADTYIFQPGSQGLAPQFDEMETFILQVEGKCKWKLYKPLQELPQEASPDLELSDLDEPTHEFDMEPGDLLYFPRGTVYFPVPIEDKDHATYLTLTTFQENTWGNMLTSALSKAVERAMESDVEYRKGLPVNLASFMGSGLLRETETEDPSEQNGDQKSDEDAADKKPANPRTTFNRNLLKLVKGLVRHLNPDKAVDDMLLDFFGGRLPPYGKKDAKKGKKKSVPSDESKIKLLHPDHVRVLIGDLSDGVAGTDGSDDEESEAEEEAEEEDSEEEASEESEKDDEKSSKKGAKKQKVEKKPEKAKETKTKSKKKAESEEEEEDEEEEEEEMEEDKEEEDLDYEEGSGDENEGFDNEEGGDEIILVLHSYKNNRATHMMGDKNPRCSILKFPIRYKDALRQITSEREKYVAVSSLQLAEKERVSLVKSLWEEGLLEME